MYVPATKYTYLISADLEPVGSIRAPDQITIQTLDASTNRVKDSHNIEYIPVTEVNPATGPILIENAAAGDILAVKILDIWVNDGPHIKLWPGLCVCHSSVKSPLTKVCTIRNRTIEYSPSVRLPVCPMIGVIGTAPVGRSFPTVTGGTTAGTWTTRFSPPAPPSICRSFAKEVFSSWAISMPAWETASCAGWPWRRAAKSTCGSMC